MINYDNEYGGAVIQAQAVSNQYSRDISGVEFSILGDPTLYPGEAIRVYNTGLNDYGMPTKLPDNLIQVSKAIARQEFIQYWSKHAFESKITTTADLLPDENVSQAIDELNNLDLVNTDKDKLILPCYTIRSVNHRINRNGFLTTINAVSDLGI